MKTIIAFFILVFLIFELLTLSSSELLCNLKVK